MPRVLKNAVMMSHEMLNEVVEEGDVVVDATCGKGYDTVFLSKLVGNRGKVYSFDIQEIAIDIAKKNVADNACCDNIKFIIDGHENVDVYVDEEPRAVIFNLGYLPTGDHSIATRGNTTVVAVEKALKLVCKNGVVIVVVYSGGDTGFEEKNLVLGFTSKLNSREYNVMRVDFINQVNNPPLLLCIEKLF